MTETDPEVDPSEQGDPAATDTGDAGAVPPGEQAEADDPAPNDDAGDTLDDVTDGEVSDADLSGEG